MKPDPWSLEHAGGIAGVPLAEAVLIGDSDTDVHAAHEVGAACIGYANRPEKTNSLARAGADAVITTMRALLEE